MNNHLCINTVDIIKQADFKHNFLNYCMFHMSFKSDFKLFLIYFVVLCEFHHVDKKIFSWAKIWSIGCYFTPDGVYILKQVFGSSLSYYCTKR